MIAKDPVQSRPGGRSSRVQASVHQAVRKLLERMPREELTFPLIATEAGVTPSTLYRRWGDLPQLLADVALERIRPIAEPADTGSLHGDLQAWTEQYIEEMGSPLGRTLLRDTLVATQEDQVTCACVDIIRDQLGIVLSRARARGESGPDVDTMLDQLVAPIVYRILYGLQPDVAFGRKLVEHLTEHLTPKQA